jgi:hypothetical protein
MNLRVLIFNSFDVRFIRGEGLKWVNGLLEVATSCCPWHRVTEDSKRNCLD